uniref:Uncharacterized protein n=1 Tax=viral metagenome TaxID=1070528 RepID=A0A6H1Z7S4_9ZZZZ
MKRALVLSLICVVGLAFATFAGPTLGLGLGWYLDNAWVAPSIGLQYLGDSFGGLGFETDIHFAELLLETGDAFEFAMGGFWEILLLTYPVIPQVDVLFGVGTPFWIEADADEGALGAFDLGWLFGFSLESEASAGLKVLGYYNGDSLGAGFSVYVDVLGRPRGEE